MNSSFTEKVLVGYSPFGACLLLSYRLYADGVSTRDPIWQLLTIMGVIGLFGLAIVILFFYDLSEAFGHPVYQAPITPPPPPPTTEEIRAREEAAERQRLELKEQDRIREVERRRKEEEVVARAKEAARRKIEAKRNRTHLEALEEALEEF